LDRTEKVVRQILEMAKATPGVDHVIGFPSLGAGLRITEQRRGAVLPVKPFNDATTKDCREPPSSER